MNDNADDGDNKFMFEILFYHFIFTHMKKKQHTFDMLGRNANELSTHRKKIPISTLKITRQKKNSFANISLFNHLDYLSHIELLSGRRIETTTKKNGEIVATVGGKGGIFVIQFFFLTWFFFYQICRSWKNALWNVPCAKHFFAAARALRVADKWHLSIQSKNTISIVSSSQPFNAEIIIIHTGIHLTIIHKAKKHS